MNVFLKRNENESKANHMTLIGIEHENLLNKANLKIRSLFFYKNASVDEDVTVYFGKEEKITTIIPKRLFLSFGGCHFIHAKRVVCCTLIV